MKFGMEGLEGRTVALSQGKAIGGSSAINAHVFVPPAKSLIDVWEELGNEGWGWDVMQKYFAKAYTSPPLVSSSSKMGSTAAAAGDDNDNGKENLMEKMLGIDGWAARNDAAKGPIKTSFAGNPAHPIRQAWAEAFAARGRSMANDPFLHGTVGSFSALSSIHPETKARSYAGSAYYHPIKERANLCVLQNAAVERILFDTNNSSKPPRATGVQYKHGGDEAKTAAASKEVLLAAGVLQSPKILELSGIGDGELLRRHGVEAVVADLPAVGENLHDHLVCYIGYEAADGMDTLDALIRREPEAIGRAMREYAAATPPGGMLTSVGVYTYAYLSLMDYCAETEGEGDAEGGQEGREFLRDLLRQHRPSDGDGDGDTDSTSKARARAYYDIAEKTLLSPSEPSGAYLTATSPAVPPPTIMKS
ncbi:hypothetical protein SLS62_003674 [Diatrype stigma]|uniref:Glucose-methanol-choline oxidoreductase N-terminal domain-containing protein n=1 Tax=Diatrype stigma TaxID=117547 RepID=A0AAN9UVR4_9PEZI